MNKIVFALLITTAPAFATPTFAVKCSATKVYQVQGADPEIVRQLSNGVTFKSFEKHLGHEEMRYVTNQHRVTIGNRTFSTESGRHDYIKVRTAENWLEAVFGRSLGYAHYLISIANKTTGELYYKANTYYDEYWTKLADLNCK